MHIAHALAHSSRHRSSGLSNTKTLALVTDRLRCEERAAAPGYNVRVVGAGTPLYSILDARRRVLDTSALNVVPVFYSTVTLNVTI